jgi:hypothetical protein
MKKKFIRPLFIEVRSRPSRLSSRLQSRASRVSKKNFPKPNRQARISLTRLSTSPTEIAFFPMKQKGFSPPLQPSHSLSSLSLYTSLSPRPSVVCGDMVVFCGVVQHEMILGGQYSGYYSAHSRNRHIQRARMKFAIAHWVSASWEHLCIVKINHLYEVE